MQFNLADMIQKEVTIARALKNPALAVKRNPTLENFAKVVAGDIEQVAIVKMARDFEEMFSEVYDGYALINGIYEDIPDPSYKDGYEEGLDDQVEEAVGPYMPGLSQDWLAKNVIDTRIWTDEERQKLARSMAKEIIKQTYYKEGAAKMLADAGITNAELEVYLEQHKAGNTLTTEDDTEMAEDNSVESVALRIKATIGADFDEMTVYNDIELMMDDDDILAEGAATRLGAEKGDVEVLRALPMTLGDDAVQSFLDMIKSHTSADAKPDKPKRGGKKADATPAPGTANVPPPVPGAPIPPPVPRPEPGAVDPSVLKLLKDHSSTKDTEFAAQLGVSRGTYNNWINNKTQFVPTNEQHEAVRNEIVSHVNGLLQALAALDGTEVTEIG